VTDLAQQKKFDRFRRVFNHERPHEALGNETPASIYVPSTRLLPSRVESFQYPRSFQTRRVKNSGDISWHKGRVFVSEVFRNEEIGLEQMNEDIHRVFFCNTEPGRVQQFGDEISPGASNLRNTTNIVKACSRSEAFQEGKVLISMIGVTATGIYRCLNPALHRDSGTTFILI
jgi:hypothetical protein